MKLTKNERMELQRQASARNGRADSARRARLMLPLAAGRGGAGKSDRLVSEVSATMGRTARRSRGMRRPRRDHSAAFKAKVALAALKGDQTLAALAQQFDVHPNLITQWKTELLQRAAEVFATAAEKRKAAPDLKTLHAKIGQLTLENDFLSVALGRIGDASAKR